MVVLLSDRTAAMTKRLRRKAQITKHLQYLDEEYQLLEITRDQGAWDSGDTPERYTLKATGRCKVYGSGTGGPRLADVIYPESPYRLRVLASEFVTEGSPIPGLVGMVIVVNNARVFDVDDLKVDDKDDLLADLYITERIGEPVPEVLP